MRIAYVLLWNINGGHGIAQKVKMQTDTWKELGHDAKIFCNVISSDERDSESVLGQNSSFYHHKSWVRYFACSKSNLLEDIEKFNPDVIYFRFEIFQPYHWALKNRAPVIMELNADDLTEYKNRARGSLKRTLLYNYHRLTRNQLFRAVDGLVSVTREMSTLQCMTKFDLPIDVVPNAVNLKYLKSVEYEQTGKRPQLLLMASSDVEWHGHDKVIKLAEETEGRLDIHLVGNLQDPSGEKKPSNLTYHGYLDSSQFASLFRKIDVCLGSLAYYRKGLYESCSLKTREYLAAGIPVILACKDTAFLDVEQPDWILHLPSTPSNVQDNIENIVDFSLAMRGRRLTHAEVAPFIDAPAFERKRLAFLSRFIPSSLTGRVKGSESGVVSRLS